MLIDYLFYFYLISTEWMQYGHKNRFITVFWYMSDVEEGGETGFPRAEGQGSPQDMWACQGLKVKPTMGKVVMWYNLLPNGNLDQNSLHQGCSVLKGEKWAANKWIWNKPFR
jgi:prolyl 4-hydroxylase